MRIACCACPEVSRVYLPKVGDLVRRALSGCTKYRIAAIDVYGHCELVTTDGTDFHSGWFAPDELLPW